MGRIKYIIDRQSQTTRKLLDGVDGHDRMMRVLQNGQDRSNEKGETDNFVFRNSGSLLSSSRLSWMVASAVIWRSGVVLTATGITAGAVGAHSLRSHISSIPNGQANWSMASQYAMLNGSSSSFQPSTWKIDQMSTLSADRFSEKECTLMTRRHRSCALGHLATSPLRPKDRWSSNFCRYRNLFWFNLCPSTL